jgi:hypothetical protein
MRRYSKPDGFWEVVATWIGAMRDGVVDALTVRMREEGVE